MRRISKVAVLGAGVMGSGIAAHLANVGIRCYLLDIVPAELTDEERKRGLTLQDRQVRNRLAATGLERALKARPAAFYVPEQASLITVGNLEDDLEWLSEVDWIIEAVVERLPIKKSLFEKVAKYRRPGTIVSSNTSGISVNAMIEEMDEDFRRHFLGTHFFNPPRYMKLLEIIPTRDTDPDVVEFMRRFSTDVLGKGVVIAKDTPNFIANRIGTFGMLATIRIMLSRGYRIDEIDAITGPAMGRPKSASFRTLDLVGLDTFVHVAGNVRENVEDPAEKEAFSIPDFVQEMLKRGWLGEKSGQGFYKKIKRDGQSQILTLDYTSMEYVPREKPRIESLGKAKGIQDVGQRVKHLLEAGDRAGSFVWEVLKLTLLYTAKVTPEIADDILSVDNAMKWGFNWELGPYELWDAIGVKESVERMAAEGEQIPAWIQEMLDAGHTSFYMDRRMYDFRGRQYVEMPTEPRVMRLAAIKKGESVVKRNTDASLVDLGDGVACLEMHSPNQAITPDFVKMIYESLEEVDRNFVGLVISNQAKNFCVGANLLLLLMEIGQGNWDGIQSMVKAFQDATLAMKHFHKPVVAAPFGMTLGGGCEIALAAHRIQASAETYIGLVEFGVGLLPGGGGNKELLLRHLEAVPSDGQIPFDLTPYVARVFEQIAMAKVATSAHEAKKMRFLRPSDNISVNGDFLLYDAKRTVLDMVRDGFRPPAPARIKVLGEAGRAALEAMTYNMMKGGFISEYDKFIADKIAYVLTGGEAPAGSEVSEEYLLELEREAFVDLCRQEKSQERMRHMLSTGKPLRN